MNAITKRLKDGSILNDRYQIEEMVEMQDIGFLYLCRDRAAGGIRTRLRILHKDRLGVYEISSISGELSLLRRLRHSSLGRVLNFGIVEDSRDLFVAQEWIEGRDILSGTEGMSVENVLVILMDIVRVLHYLHSRGIVHGCLNPNNIILTQNGERKKAKLLDFGLVRQCPGSCVGARYANPAYMAPELLLGGAVTQGSDMYSLGVLIYQLLTRKLPFEDADPGFLMEKHLQVNIDLRPVTRLRNGAVLKEVLCDLLEKKVSQRSGSCEGVLRALTEVLGRNLSDRDNKDLENYFSASRIVGREREQQLLKQSAGRVQETKRGWTIFVSGEGGLGKSRLLEEFSDWAALEGWRVIEGACGRQEGPYAPYRQILAKTDKVGGESLFRFQNPPVSSESGDFESSPEFAAGQFRDLLTRELVRRLSKWPTLLLLHDFHLADEATSTVLDYLSSDIQTHPILMCVSLRSGEDTNGNLKRVIDQTIRQQRGEVLELEPLMEENVGQLVSGIAGDRRLKETLGSWMHSNIGGNPFFLEEMLRHLVEQGLLHYELDRLRFKNRELLKLAVPETIGAVLQRRLGELSPQSAELARWLALFHRPVSKPLLGLVLSWEEEKLTKAIKELRERQLIRVEMKAAEEIAELSHVMTAEVIRGNIPKARRRNMHRRIAEVLDREHGGASHFQEIAMHAMEGRAGAKSVRYALALATQSHAEFAHEKALKCYQYVFKNRGDLTSNELCQAAIDASDTMFALELPVQAIRVLTSEMKQAAKINTEMKSGMLLQFAIAFKHLGDPVKAELFCRKGLACLRNSSIGKSSTKTTFWTELAFHAMLRSKTKLGLRYINKSLDSCPDPENGVLAGRIQNLKASLFRVACKFDEALIAGQRAVNILSKCEKSYLTCSAYSTLGLILMGLGRFSLALQIHEKAVFLSEKSRSVALRAQASANLLECLSKMGRIGNALEVADNSSECISELQNPAITNAYMAILAEIRLNVGDYKETRIIIQQLEKRIKKYSALYISGHVHFIAASLEMLLGNFESALTHINLISAIQLREAPFYEKELAEALRARIYFERGLTQKATKLLHSLDVIVTKKRWPYHMCIIKLHKSELLLKQFQYYPALKNANDALRLARGMNCDALLIQSQFIIGLIYSALSQADADSSNRHELAAKHLLAVCKSDQSTYGETLWRAHLELALIYNRTMEDEIAWDHAEKAFSYIGKLEAKVPDSMIQSYRMAFNRDKIRSETLQKLNLLEDLSKINKINLVKRGIEDDGRLLLKLSVAVSSTLDINCLLEKILDQLIIHAGLDRAFVLLFNELDGRLQFTRGRDRLLVNIKETDFGSGSLLYEVFKTGNPIVSANAANDPRFGENLTLPGNPGMLLCAPLKISKRILGVLYADCCSQTKNLSESVVNLFEAFTNLAAIAIDNAIAHQQLAKEKSELELYLHEARDEYPEIIGKSAITEKLRDRISLAAMSPLDILVIGESGTGKELVAKAIYRTGKRKGGKFIAVDCGSLSDSLAEAELFGYRKGAFTGAIENRPGLFEAAQGGILFLDEVSNMPLRTQPKLLRVLQEREIRRIGETTTRKIDIQIVAATNKDILQEISEGRFREDLYHRLRGMEIRVPPLRERSGDIPILLEWYLLDTIQGGGKNKKFANDAKQVLYNYNYPGNIRELKNIVADSYYSAKEYQIAIADLPNEVRMGRVEDKSDDYRLVVQIFDQITKNNGTFENLIKKPFIERQLGPAIMRGVVEMALKESNGNYRTAFAVLRIPSRQYSSNIRFLKHYKCYPEYKSYRNRRAE